mgnify:CR=1 FL=1
MKESGINAETDKTETVYAKADSSGKIYDVSVEAVLKNEGEGEITDYSTLSDIKNTEGDEEFTEKGSNVVIWENHGEDIQYKGTSTDALPVDVKITYYLNDKQVTADELKGQSGKVRIRFDYTNKYSQKVEVNGKTVEVSTPFVVCSTMFLSSDNFSNIEVTNGKTVEMDDQNIVIGYAMPGLSDSLQLKNYEATEDVDIPEYVEVTADVTDFSLDFTATIISSGLLEDMDLKDLDEAANALAALAFAIFLQLSAGSFADVGLYFDPTHPTKAMADAAATVASQAPLLWLGAVAVGAFVPLAAAFMGRRTGSWKLWAPAAIIAALVGAVCMRVVFYNLGLSVFMFY